MPVRTIHLKNDINEWSFEVKTDPGISRCTPAGMAAARECGCTEREHFGREPTRAARSVLGVCCEEALQNIPEAVELYVEERILTLPP